MLKIIANLSLRALDQVVLEYIQEHPGKRLFEIDRATLNSHHNWGAKCIVNRLDAQKKIFIVKQKKGGVEVPTYFPA